MKILILGSTGRTGKLLLEECLNLGYEVNCLVRDMGKISPKLSTVTYFEGTPADKVALKNAIQGCEAVVSALNVSRTSDFPWAPLRTPPTFLSKVMQNLIELHAENPLSQIVICSAWGVHETLDDIPWWFRMMIQNSNIGPAYADHERQENLLVESGIPFTIVRPAGLTNFSKKGKVKVSYENTPKPGLMIFRGDVAAFMAEAVGNQALIGKKPTISAG
ncbi:MAG: NAD(P)H-binding protein [Bacteroidota bacterium]